MEYESYRVPKEEKLENLAKQFGLTTKELQEINPNIQTFTNFWGTEAYVVVNQLIKVPVKSKEKAYGDNNLDFDFVKSQKEKEAKLSEEERFLKNLTFDQQVRYRCEQLNMTKIEDRIMFHFNTKKQYLLKNNLLGKISKIQLEEYLYKINPENLADPIEAMKQLEYAKENVILKFNDNGIEEILNYSKIKTDWNNFIPVLKKMDFYTSLEKLNPNAAQDILKGGDSEFGSKESLKKTYDKNLFFHTLYNSYNPQISETTLLNFISQIFVNIPIELELQHSIVKEDDFHIEYRTVGTLNRDKINNKVLEEQYNKFYRPIIEYSFSQYNYEYRIRRTVEKKTGLITNAIAMLKEEVKNNYQFVTQFDLKKIES